MGIVNQISGQTLEAEMQASAIQQERSELRELIDGMKVTSSELQTCLTAIKEQTDKASKDSMVLQDLRMQLTAQAAAQETALKESSGNLASKFDAVCRTVVTEQAGRAARLFDKTAVEMEAQQKKIKHSALLIRIALIVGIGDAVLQLAVIIMLLCKII